MHTKMRTAAEQVMDAISRRGGVSLSSKSVKGQSYRQECNVAACRLRSSTARLPIKMPKAIVDVADNVTIAEGAVEEWRSRP
jgi:hypothetical protein